MRKKIQSASLLAFAAIIIIACNAPTEKAEPIDMDNLKVEIQAMEDAFSAAEKSKDADAVVVYYSEDAISYSRNQQPTIGKAAIRQRIADGLAADTTGSYNVYKVVDLFAEGNSAVEVGSWSEFDASGTETATGHYMSYFQKRDGKYVCVRDMNVTSAAAQ